ncbi:MAG: RNA pyrophosphohydrolase [Myxococcales bacterium]|nr:RNA pyrophosphohydrolase [Myxococcales bacterium]
MAQTFRANVGILVLHGDGRVLAMERKDWSEPVLQLPQGGIEPGEEPTDAAYRELLEETGLSPEHVQLVGEHPHWLAYEWPADTRAAKSHRGQVQKYFAFRLLADEACIRPTDEEFRAWRWMTMQALTECAVYFRQPVYRQVLEYFRRVLADG